MADKRELERLRNAIRTIEKGSKAAPSANDVKRPKRHDPMASQFAETVMMPSENKSDEDSSSRVPGRHKNTVRALESSELSPLPRGDGPLEKHEVVKGCELLKDSELAEKTLEGLDEEQNVTSGMLRQAALNLLAQREQSEGELRQKLERRFPGHEALKTEVIVQLQLDGLQSDARLAESYVRYRSQRGQGPNKIRSELSQKSVSSALITETLNDESIDWVALARLVLEKRFGESLAASSLDAKERARRSRFLQQRGFHYEHISAAL
ncbi:MAG: regulatory protein RecX [Pseudomonadales bacterium]